MDSDKQIVRCKIFNETKKILKNKYGDTSCIILSFLLCECSDCRRKYLINSDICFDKCMTCGKIFCDNCRLKKPCICIHCSLDYIHYCKDCFF